MLILETIKLALVSLTTSRLRSFLTLIGIAVGLFSIIIVMTAIGAIQSSVEEAFNSIGTTNFIIQKYPALNIGGHNRSLYRNRKDLTIAEGEKLRAMTTLPAAVGISVDRGGRIVKYGNLKTNPEISLAGVNLDEILANDYTVSEGRGLSKADIDFVRPVCVIGSGIAEKLFINIYPVGQEIKVDGLVLQVIGVFEKKGSILGQSQDNFMVIPITLYEKEYGKNSHAGYTIMARSPALIQATMDEVTGALRKIRKVEPSKPNDFEIITNDQLIEQFNDLTKYFKLGAAVVAFIALLAAGIGIMNIMLVTVTERTREIGIRKAIGAKKYAIRTQFVIEAFVLSQVGGITGILLGIIGGNIVALWLHVSLILPIDWIIIGLVVTSMVGIGFGVYPAVKASNLDPIEALRYE